MGKATVPVSATKGYVMQESKGSILFVDNHEDTCEMMRTVLRQCGYKVTTATNLTDGLWFARKSGYDLILLGWYFQDGTGIELCNLIRLFDNDTPIFFYTGADVGNEVKEIKEAGAQGCFIKPLSIKELLETVSTYAHNVDSQSSTH
jgi:DNA-binding response OmpR family regulator